MTVFADTAANPTKLDRIRRFGATVVQDGVDFDEARLAAERFAAERGDVLLVDGTGADPVPGQSVVVWRRPR